MNDIHNKLKNNYQNYIKTNDGQEKWSRQFFHKILAQNDVVYITAKESSRSYLIARIAGDDMEIIALGIDKNYRRKGAATSMINKLIIITKKKKIKRIILEVSKENTAALNLYKKLGFFTYNVRENYYTIKKKKESAYLMQKRITF